MKDFFIVFYVNPIFIVADILMILATIVFFWIGISDKKKWAILVGLFFLWLTVGMVMATILYFQMILAGGT